MAAACGGVGARGGSGALSSSCRTTPAGLQPPVAALQRTVRVPENNAWAGGKGAASLSLGRWKYRARQRWCDRGGETEIVECTW